ncbi:MAG: hypothetical protein KDA20_09555 [Phycisphaerales bacterium]|nr:hypothetical protein [Phycisphaerales bacterium]
MKISRPLLALVLAVVAAQSSLAANSITYQGQLNQNGLAVTGRRNMNFSLWTAASGGSQIAGPLVINNVQVDGGLFQVELNFTGEDIGATNTNRWLQITVEGNTLSPRQLLTASPYSIQTRGIFVNNAGDVGIGTNSPSFDFHLKETKPAGTGQPPVSLSLEWTQSVIGTPPRDWLTFRVGGSGNVAAGQDGAHIIHDSDSKLHISTESSIGSGTPTPQLTIDTNNRFGIGTTSPSANAKVTISPPSQNAALLALASNNIGPAIDAINLGASPAVQAANNGGAPAIQALGGNDTSLGGGGIVNIGNFTSSNISIDTNEIMARNNGSTAPLYLNADGGDVIMGAQRTKPPYAYGRILEDGTLVNASPNVTGVAWSTDHFFVHINGGFLDTDVVIITDGYVGNGAPTIGRGYRDGTDLLIATYNTVDGWDGRNPVNFVVYRP